MLLKCLIIYLSISRVHKVIIMQHNKKMCLTRDWVCGKRLIYSEL